MTATGCAMVDGCVVDPTAGSMSAFGTSRKYRGVPARLLMATAFSVALAGCAGSPPTVQKSPSFAPEDTGTTFLAQRAKGLGDPGDGRSGIHMLVDGPEALGVRLVLSEKAERSIDAQYYLLHDDPTGHLFTWSLLEAADRGVRVRLLVDDMDTSSYDAMTAALSTHPNFDIRLFNPFARGLGKNIASAFDFRRVTRRMHNKSMTFDNQVTVVGGRNIGAEYFAARDDSNYDDLDLLAAGPVAREVSRSFDDYWNSPFAIPVADVVRNRDKKLSLDEARSRLSVLAEQARTTEYGDALTQGIRDALNSGDLVLDWVPATVMADPPEKADSRSDPTETLFAAMVPYFQSAQTELVVASAYFVPGERGTEFLASLEERGVQVRILTNSLDSTDVTPVHGHYAHYRKDLLEAGVELWELRPDKARPDRELLGLGQSLSGLHSKAFTIDRHYLFIGSFNWDPRSVFINTEMGILLESPERARRAVENFDRELADSAYRLRLDKNGQIEWLARGKDGSWIAHRKEPSKSAWRKFMSGVYGTLPIRSQL